MTPAPSEPIRGPAPAFNLLSLVASLPAPINQLIAKKEATDRKCAELERLVAEEKEARCALQQENATLQQEKTAFVEEKAKLVTRHSKLMEDERTTRGFF